MSEITARDRFRGCLLGLAAGDALGTALEFRKPGTFEPIDDMIGAGCFGLEPGQCFDLEPGQWTDDTSMALCLATSLIECGGFDPMDQMRRYVRWWREGYLSSVEGRCIDIGYTVKDALSLFERTGDPYAGSSDLDTAGNGSLMRLAPIPMYFAADAVESNDRSADSSRTTHGTAEAVDACRYFGGLLVGALNGVDKDKLLSERFCPVEGLWETNPLAEKIAEIADGSFRRREPALRYSRPKRRWERGPAADSNAETIEGTGYVVKSLEAALWAFNKSTDFRDGALLAVNLGEDADTTGAIYGQIAGAHYGADSIPSEWRSQLTMLTEITDMADSIYDHARRSM